MRRPILHGAFFDRAAETPNRVALRWHRRGLLSYGELADMALCVANHLRARGVVTGEPVTVSTTLGPDRAAAALGVLAAGAACHPVDDDAFLDATSMSAARATSPLAEPVAVTADHPALTDATHGEATGTVASVQAELTPFDIVLATRETGMFAALSAGCSVVLAPPDERARRDAIREHDVTVWISSRAELASLEDLTNLRVVTLD